LQGALNSKINLSGGFMTGKLSCGIGPDGTTINIGTRVGTPQPTTVSNGDLWVQNSNFNFRDALGVNQSVPNLGTANTFTNAITAQSFTTVGTGTFGGLNVSGTVNIAGQPSSVICLIGSGAASTSALKSIDIGSGGLAGSTTNIVIGSGSGGQTNIGIRGSIVISGNISGADSISSTKINGIPTAGVAGINIGIGGIPASSTTAGDLWIATGGATLNYRDAVGVHRGLAAVNNANHFTAGQAITVNSSQNALRINQQGTGPALVVEDSATPDTSAFVVDASGNVGIGVTSGYIAQSKLEVQGDVHFSNNLRVENSIDLGSSTTGDTSLFIQTVINFPNYGGTLGGFLTQTNAQGPSGNIGYADYPSEIVISLNGNQWAVPARQIV
jgi:hypothetical protein